MPEPKNQMQKLLANYRGWLSKEMLEIAAGIEDDKTLKQRVKAVADALNAKAASAVDTATGAVALPITCFKQAMEAVAADAKEEFMAAATSIIDNVEYALDKILHEDDHREVEYVPYDEIIDTLLEEHPSMPVTHKLTCTFGVLRALAEINDFINYKGFVVDKITVHSTSADEQTPVTLDDMVEDIASQAIQYIADNAGQPYEKYKPIVRALSKLDDELYTYSKIVGNRAGFFCIDVDPTSNAYFINIHLAT